MDIAFFAVYDGNLSANYRTTMFNNQNNNAAFWVATEVETVTASPIAHILQMI
jgi:general stress protein 26